MRLATALLFAVALSGCVNYTQLQAAAPTAPTYELCRAGMTHPNTQVRSIAWNELQRRGEDCAKYAQAISTQKAADEQAAQAYFNSLPKPRQPVTCTTTGFGNMAQTTCR